MSVEDYFEDWVDLVEDHCWVPPEDYHIKHILVVCRDYGPVMEEWQERSEEIANVTDMLRNLKFRMENMEETVHWTVMYKETFLLKELEEQLERSLSEQNRAKDSLEDAYRLHFGLGGEGAANIQEAPELPYTDEPPDGVHIATPAKILTRVEESLAVIAEYDGVLKRKIHHRQMLVHDAYQSLSAKLQSDERDDLLDALFAFAKAVDEGSTSAVAALAACAYDSPAQLTGDDDWPELRRSDTAVPDEIENLLIDERQNSSDMCVRITSFVDLFLTRDTQEKQRALKFFSEFLGSDDDRIPHTVRRYAEQGLRSKREQLLRDEKRMWMASLPDHRLLCPSSVKPLLQIIRSGTQPVFNTVDNLRMCQDSPLHIALRQQIMSLSGLCTGGNVLVTRYLAQKLFRDEAWTNRQLAVSALTPLISKDEDVMGLLLTKLFDTSEHSGVRTEIEAGVISALGSGMINDASSMVMLDQYASNYTLCSQTVALWGGVKQEAARKYKAQSRNHEFSTLFKKRELVAAGKLAPRKAGNTSSTQSGKTLRDMRTYRKLPAIHDTVASI